MLNLIISVLLFFYFIFYEEVTADVHYHFNEYF